MGREMAQGRVVAYIHPQLQEEVTAIGGRYVLTHDLRLPFHGQEILCFTGFAVVDTSCCGTWGCGYALVAGVLLDWKYETTEDGLAVSRVATIREPAIQNEIRHHLEKHVQVAQVVFH